MLFEPKSQFITIKRTPLPADAARIPTTPLPTMPRGSHASHESRSSAGNLRTLRTPVVRLPQAVPVRMGLRLWLLPVLVFTGLALDWLFFQATGDRPLNWYLSLAWTAYLPLTLVGIAGAFASRNERTIGLRARHDARVIFLVPTVARRDTLPGVFRVIDSLLYCTVRDLPNSFIQVVVDEGSEGLTELLERYHDHGRVSILVVPATYRTPRGTRYKARANQYALDWRRAHGLHGPDTWVYHGDDDTSVSWDTIWGICHVIEQDQADLAQGLLTYPHQLSPSWFCRLADSIRPADDMSRFYFCTGKLGTPLAGCHGEHLLVRASVEDAIGWDFGPGVTVEDAYFGLTFAARYPGRSTFLPGCCYGASPDSVSSLIRQRKRWARGLLGLLVDRQIPPRSKILLGYSIANWALGFFQHVLIVLLVAALLHTDASPVTPLLFAIWCLNFGYQMWLYLEGLRINLQVSEAPAWQFWLLPIAQLLLLPALSLVEAWAALSGLLAFLRGVQGFEVIKKGQ